MPTTAFAGRLLLTRANSRLESRPPTTFNTEPSPRCQIKKFSGNPALAVLDQKHPALSVVNFNQASSESADGGHLPRQCRESDGR